MDDDIRKQMQERPAGAAPERLSAVGAEPLPGAAPTRPSLQRHRADGDRVVVISAALHPVVASLGILHFVGHPVAVNPRPAPVRVAREAGWPILP